MTSLHVALAIALFVAPTAVAGPSVSAGDELTVTASPENADSTTWAALVEIETGGDLPETTTLVSSRAEEGRRLRVADAGSASPLAEAGYISTCEGGMRCISAAYLVMDGAALALACQVNTAPGAPFYPGHACFGGIVLVGNKAAWGEAVFDTSRADPGLCVRQGNFSADHPFTCARVRADSEEASVGICSERLPYVWPDPAYFEEGSCDAVGAWSTDDRLCVAAFHREHGGAREPLDAPGIPICAG